MIGWIILLFTVTVYLSATIANEMYRKERMNDSKNTKMG